MADRSYSVNIGDLPKKGFLVKLINLSMQLNQAKKGLSTKMELKVCFWEQNKFFSLGGAKMRIAVCDIDKDFLMQFKNEVYRYAEKSKIEVVVECYYSGEGILQSCNKYNLIFLGYSLKGMNGMEIAGKIRDNGFDTAIIFISDFTDFIFDAFKVNAFRFLRKSDWQEQLSAVLNDYFEHFGNTYPIWIKSKEDVVCISTDDIYYLEADNKHCYIHLKDDTLYCNRTMARVFEILPKNHFAKTNRAFVVNLNHISRYSCDKITLKNGDILYPSRNFYKSFREEYRLFSKPYEI